MKKFYLFILTLVFFASCTNCFVINGAVEGGLEEIDGLYVSLTDPSGTEIAAIPVEGGKFTYKTAADITTSYTLALKQSDGNDEFGPVGKLTCIPEKSEVSVFFSPEESRISGSRLTDKYLDLRNSFREVTEKAEKDINAAYVAGDEELAGKIESEYEADVKKIFTDAYLENTDNYAGLLSLKMMMDYVGLDEAEDLVAKGGDFIRNDEDIIGILDQKKAKEATSVGCKFVEIEGLDAAGKAVKLSDFVGKGDYVLVDFWASWCGPCMRAIPNARALLEKYSSKGFQLVGINCWERKAGAGQAKAVEMNMTWPVIFADNEATEAYGVEAIPTLVLFGPDGTIVERLLGEEGLTEAVARHFE